MSAPARARLSLLTTLLHERGGKVLVQALERLVNVSEDVVRQVRDLLGVLALLRRLGVIDRGLLGLGLLRLGDCVLADLLLHQSSSPITISVSSTRSCGPYISGCSRSICISSSSHGTYAFSYASELSKKPAICSP